MRITAQLLRAVDRFWTEQDLPDGVGVLVALSGGADSVALLRLLEQLAVLRSLTLQAAHLDHAIRSESAGDVEFVRQLCSEARIPLYVERADVPLLARQSGRGLEETGRVERREFLCRVAEETGCRFIALGHHRGDQAETFLMRLVRGTGLTGLAAMRPCSGPFLRPLLDVSRRQIEAVLEEMQQSFLQDASNEDVNFTRNRVRHRLLPELQGLNPRIEERLAALCRRIADEEDFWQEQVTEALAGLVVKQGAQELRLRRPGLLGLHAALRYRVLRGAVQMVRGDLRGMDGGHIEALDRMLRGAAPQAEIHLPALWAARRYDTLWLRQRSPQRPAPFDLVVNGPGEIRLPDGRQMRFAYRDRPQGESRLAVEFPTEVIGFPLQVRSFCPGDRFRPQGAIGSRKLKKYFMEARIEQEQRQGLPLLVGDRILWLAGVARCHEWSCQEWDGPVLRVTLEAD